MHLSFLHVFSWPDGSFPFRIAQCIVSMYWAHVSWKKKRHRSDGTNARCPVSPTPRTTQRGQNARGSHARALGNGVCTKAGAHQPPNWCSVGHLFSKPEPCREQKHRQSVLQERPSKASSKRRLVVPNAQ